MTLKLASNERAIAETAERNRVDSILIKVDAQQRLHDLVVELNRLLQGNRRDGTVSITLHVDSYDKEGRPLAKKSIPTVATFR